MKTRFVSLATPILLLVCGLVAAGAVAQEQKSVVNINSASVKELAFLPRVGPALAQRIIDFREENGDFKKTEELILVRGIGEGTFEMLEPYVTTEGATTLEAPVSPPSRETND